MGLTRSRAAVIAADAMRIMADGRYTTLSGDTIDISADLRAAVAGTVTYLPGDRLPAVPAADHPTRFEVTNETTLSAAERLAGANPVALNFASAKHPGGGFLRGAIAQEESLCRSSGLYACLQGNPMYALPGRESGFYTDAAIYSPGVPVFFTDAGNPLPTPYRCSFVTCAAVNAGAYLGTPGASEDRLRDEMARRVQKVLTIAAGHGHDTLILGAWGCGVFRNDPELIAGLFREAFEVRFRATFRQVLFAVLDSSADRRIVEPFERRFGADPGVPR